MKQLICGSLNGMRIRQSLLPDENANPLEGAVDGSWGLGIVEQSQERAATDHGEMDRRDVTGETVVGNACGGKPGSHGSKAI